MSTNRNRYASLRITRLPREKRALPQRGYLEDHRQWYKCWNCHFLIKDSRTALGGDESHSGVSPYQYSEEPDFNDFGKADGDPAFSTLAAMLVCDVSGSVDVTLRKLGPDGLPIPVVRLYKPNVNAGCPLCGTLNWR